MTPDFHPAHAARSLAAHRSLKHLARTAVGFGAITAGLVGAVGASWATLHHQAREATDTIESAARQAALRQGLLTGEADFNWQDLPPSGDGTYLPGWDEPRQRAPRGTRVLTVLGDSTSVGYGCMESAELPGVILAKAAARDLRAPVRLSTRGVVGCTSADLSRQAHDALQDKPRAVAIMIGANDVRDLVPPLRAARQLREAVRFLRAQGIAVVVGTCPDLGVIMPIQQPLRRVAGTWSKRLARAQGRATVSAGGVAVALDRLVSPEFYGHPELFYADGFHPSALGYAKATAALTPAVVDALR